MSVLLLVLGFILIIGLVVIHEFGHFIMARRNGVTVEEFGIFFPPRLYKHKTKAGWNFTINALPLGGFVKMKGEHDSDTEPGTFGAAGVWAKTKIMAAGVVMNLIVALVMFTIIAWIGMPKFFPNQFTINSDTKTTVRTLVYGIETNSPAQKAGIKTYDQISAIGLPHQKPDYISNSQSLPQVAQKFAGKTVDVYLNRGDKSMTKKLTLLTTKVVNASKSTKNPKGYLGVILTSPITNVELRYSTWSAPVVAIGLTGQIIGITYHGLVHALGGLGSLIAGIVTDNKVARQHGQANATKNVGGPVLIYVLLKSYSVIGYRFILMIVAYISLVLAIMNILPIPALDGGRLWITLITRAIKKPLSAKKEELINATSLFILLFLIVLLTISNVKNYL